MRKILVIVALVVLLVFTSSSETTDVTSYPSDTQEYITNSPNYHLLSDAGGLGDPSQAVVFFSRQINGQSMSLINSYAAVNTHSTSLDLSNYWVPGWTLYNATMSVSGMTAVSEHVVVGSAETPGTGLRIWEYNTDVYYNHLSQGFYNRTHDGKLENYTASYFTLSYNTGLRGTAYFEIRSDYSNASSNITTPFALVDHPVGFDWETISGESVILSENGTYYAIVDGSDLHEDSIVFTYPSIFWGADSTSVFDTRRYSTEFSSWSNPLSLEALLNYTYVPWNSTSNSALTFSSPLDVQLTANSSSLVGSEWIFKTSTGNLSKIDFSSDLSLTFDYNLSLLYRQDKSSTTSWGVSIPGSTAKWNSTTTIAYPNVQGYSSGGLNISIPSDWTPNGLYNSTTPGTDYGNYVDNGLIVTCSSMTNGTWTITNAAPNYVTDVSLLDTVLRTPLSIASISDNLEVNATIRDGLLNIVETGTTNLTIYKGGLTIWIPSNQSVNSIGTTAYLWDIDTTTSDNGIYTAEIYWTNGTEAGYLTQDIVVYFPTSMNAAAPHIDAFTEDSFAISVYFEDTFTPQGIDGTIASVEYSFDGGSNTSMVDHGNGTWTASVSTIGRSPGSYNLNVFGEGFAIENQTVSITIDLLHETQPLMIQWSNGNDITYVESTELQVTYRRVNGQNVSTAIVNVTIGADTWPLIWNPASQYYSITFNGTDAPPGFGVHSVSIVADDLGYLSQSDTTEFLTLREEPTSLIVSWTNTNNITYVESTTLQVTYRMSNTTAIPDATVNATIGGTTWTLIWNGGTYDLAFNGSDIDPGFGTHSLTIRASKTGYESKIDSTENVTLREEPTSLVVAWTNTDNITYVETTILRVTYRMSNNTSIPGAVVNVTIGGTTWPLTWNDVLKIYEVEFNGTDSPPGFGIHSLSIAASKTGYQQQTDDTETLELTEEPTSITILWSDDSTISYIASTILSVSYRMSNGTPIPNAIGNVTIGGTDWDLIWDPFSQTYNHTFDGTDDPPGIGGHSLSVVFDKFGYVSKTDSTETLTIEEESTSLIVTWTNTNSITYVESTILQVIYRMSDLSAVTSAEVNVTIGGTTWGLIWHGATQSYRITFNGTDSPPGFGTHNLLILADRFGFVSQTNSTETLTVQLEGTNLVVSLTPDNDVTYTDYSTLIAEYTMSNGSAVVGALVNVTIGSDVWILVWNGINKDYRIRFNGSDAPPGFDIHSLVVRADTFGYVGQTNSSLILTLREEPTLFSVQWTNTNNVSYVDSTTLQISYTMTNGTPVTDAVVNVTIDGTIWPLIWNSGSGYFEIKFNGSDIPPGLGTHSMSIVADFFGYVSKSDNTETLILREEFTNLTIAWSSGSTITYVERTILSITYTMSNGTPISGAIANATIGGITWQLIWDPLSETYNHTFFGIDDPPGFGSNPVQITSDRFGYEAQSDSLESLTIEEESTSLQFEWSNTDTISYVENTILSATYLMSNGSSILNAELNVTIGGTTWTLEWNGASAYEHTFRGTDDPPGFGVHAIVVQADRFGYVSRINSSESLTIQLESTSIVVSLTPDNDVTFTEFSVLIVNYTMSNGSAVMNAVVNVTIGSNTWILNWDNGNQDYRIRFNGTDSPPGFGTYTLNIKAGLFGYVQQSDSSQTLTLREEPTTLSIQWTNTNSPSYRDSTVLQVDYAMLNGTPVSGAIINVTIDTTTWNLVWNGVSGYYEIQFNGSDVPPGVGTHSLTIKAGLEGYQSHEDTTETLTLPVVPTTIVLWWTNTNDITFVETTTLVANYTMDNGTAVFGATLNLTIDSTRWDFVWNASSETYEVVFRGSDDPPGLGAHSISLLAGKLDHEGHSVDTETLTLSEETTSLVVSWEMPSLNNISYLESSTLSVAYTMSNGSPVVDAVLNVTIGGTTWNLLWNSGTEAYELVYNGSDADPGFGTHSLTIVADKFGYEAITDSSEELTLRVEDTFLAISWTQGSTITYVESTILRASYTLRNGSSVTTATINVTISSTTWTLVWNGGTGFYEYMFLGSDAPPGLGIHPLSISAWKANYLSYLDISETLTINEETTSLSITWSDGTSITYVGSTTLSANFTMSNGTAITSAEVNVTIGGDTWSLYWDGIEEVYMIQFNGSDSLPGLGVHGLTISLDKFGYEAIIDSSQVLTITGELGTISSEWIGGDTISYLGQTILSVNYTMSNGTAIPLATVNVTIDGTLWDLVWHDASGTYRIQFNGTDSPPGLGTHGLVIRAWRDGFDGQTDSSKTLTINDEYTTLTISWTAPYYNNISYFQYTTLRARYQMSNGSDIVAATVNVTISGTTWQLWWNTGFYELRFNGSDSPPGLGTHSLSVQADKHGYQNLIDGSESLIMRKDPTSIEVTWPTGDIITYVEHTKIVVFYRMSNGTVIPTADANITIGGQTWVLIWNQTSGGYEKTFNGNDNPPGLGSFIPTIMAQGSIFVAQSTTTQLTIIKEPTTATPNWWSVSFVYASSAVLSVEYRDSYGALITGASQKYVYVNGTQYTMFESAGTYWYQMDYRLGMGYHTVEVNISKAGYEFSYIDSIHFNITENPTSLFVTWSATTIDYVGQADLSVRYWDDGASRDVSTGLVVANLTIDSSLLIPMTNVGNYWIANLTGVSLDLGTHDIVIRFWAAHYQYQENYTLITVNQVSTDPLLVTWDPANVTIEYVQSLNLSIDYTYYGGDVPGTSSVNVTIDSTTYDMTYSGGLWSISIPGIQLGLGVYNAFISAWNYGYLAQTNLTLNVNVTLAANSFIVTWEPFDGEISYVEEVNISVVYTYDYSPIVDATVSITVNGTRNYSLVYSALDEMWHTTIQGTEFGLGIWNVTVTANRTGYQTGTELKFINVTRDLLQTSSDWTIATIDFVSTKSLVISCNASNDQGVLDATIIVEVDSQFYSITNEGDGFYSTILGPQITPGIHSVDIAISGSWFYTATLNLSLIVTIADTQISTAISSYTTIYFDGIVSGAVNFTLTNKSFVSGSNIEILAAGKSIIASGSSGSWSFSIQGTFLGVGNHSCSLNLTAFGFETQFYEFYILVESIPTELALTGRDWMYINDTTTMRIQFTDARNSSYIQADTLFVDWAGDYSIVVLPSGIYNISIQTYGLPNGNYTFSVTLSVTGYNSSSDSIVIEVKLLPIQIIASPPIVEYEYEHITVWAYVVDEYHGTNVTWATIFAIFNDEPYLLSYNILSGLYTIEIILTASHLPGDYSINLNATADDFVDSMVGIPVTILAKSTYSLTLEVPEEIVPDSEITIVVSLNSEGTPVPGETISLLYILNYSDGSTPQQTSLTLITGTDGTATSDIQIPVDASHIEIWAAFEGSREAWNAESDHQEREIKIETTEPPPPLFSDPMTITLVGGVSAVALVFVLVRRRRSIGGKTTSSAVDLSTTTATTTSSLGASSSYSIVSDGVLKVSDVSESLSEILGISREDVSSYSKYISSLGIATTVTLAIKASRKDKTQDGNLDIDRVSALLKTSTSGLTRGEISEKLKLSSKKIREIVKEMLDSGDFVEVPDGRKRRIVLKPKD